MLKDIFKSKVVPVEPKVSPEVRDALIGAGASLIGTLLGGLLISLIESATKGPSETEGVNDGNGNQG